MIWTSDKPTTPGWYWHCGNVGVPRVAHVYQGQHEMWVEMAGCRTRKLADATGTWSTEPIPEPRDPIDPLVLKARLDAQGKAPV